MSPNIRIVLVNTTHPGNIGAVARAMKNMGFDKLTLVAPKIFPDPEAVARASGADDLLEKAVVTDRLADALEGCGLVIGASARSRSLAWPVIAPRQCAALAVQESTTHEVAIVFGREHSGLTNEELALCQYQLRIPCNEEFASLNLAAAVQVIAYECLLAGQGVQETTDPGDSTPAAMEDIEQFYHHLEQVLIEIDFLNPDRPRQLMRRLRRLYNRARPDQNELNILRGILTAVQQSRSANRSSTAG